MKLLDKLRSDNAKVERVLAYARARLREKSTLGGIAAAVAAGAVVPAPYSYVIIGIGVIAVFYPEAK